MIEIVYLNGNFVHAADAKISVFDRGFTFGDSVYEVIPVYRSQPYFVKEHLARLSRSLASVDIENPPIDWLNVFQTLIEQNGGGDMQIYLQITRGDHGKRLHQAPKTLKPTIVAYTLKTPFPTFDAKLQGLHAHLVNDFRWSRCDIKTTSLLANIMINNDALSNGADTAILIRDNKLTEGASNNVFMVSADGVVRTSINNTFCLPGITREVTIKLINDLQWPFLEGDITPKELLEAQEIWITSTTKEIFPITRIDDKVIGNGQGGKFWRIINQQFQNLIQPS